MLILTHDTLRNPGILDVRQLPRRIFGRVTPWPRALTAGHLARMMAEFQGLRFAVPMLPLVAAMLIWPGMAIALAQAPPLMIVAIWFAETRILRVPPGRRAGLIDAAAADRGLDLLRVQGRAALTRIAAGRDMRSGALRLVIEQSDLARLPPLTYVSVQSEDGPAILDLTAAERALLAEDLFRPPLSEALLQRINQSSGVFLREVSLDARGVSAHARLAAALG